MYVININNRTSRASLLLIAFLNVTRNKGHLGKYKSKLNMESGPKNVFF
jgi:hypothetical protein